MKRTYGLIAAFDTTPDLFHACEKVRDAGYKQWDSLTSFPVHGLDAAMGIKRSKVPRISICGGITGFAT
ncbi:MAG TPA: quinol:electron acceptor oxidoreductase subunit ActD, partial [Candidatus Didemnitutus sp.]|nr:quinol:electron acceptor oxidoreductase subunit ActD [Candidatus Didemnitutus sp.]